MKIMFPFEIFSGLIIRYFVVCLSDERTGNYFLLGWFAFCYLIMAIVGFTDLFSGTDQPFPIGWYMFLFDTVGYGIMIWLIRDKMKENIF